MGMNDYIIADMGMAEYIADMMLMIIVQIFIDNIKMDVHIVITFGVHKHRK